MQQQVQLEVDLKLNQVAFEIEREYLLNVFAGWSDRLAGRQNPLRHFDSANGLQAADAHVRHGRRCRGIPLKLCSRYDLITNEKNAFALWISSVEL